MLRTIAVPLLAPALIAGGLLSFTFSLEDLVTSVFVSTAQVTPLPVFILASLHSQFHTDIFAIAVFLFVSTTVLFLVALVVMGGGSRSRMRRGLRLLGATQADEAM
jgi:ABC-type spermidine/putrescine transport system permease subunit II